MEPEHHYLLLYEYVEDILEKRGPYREGHLGLMRQLKDEGRVLMGGAIGDPPTGAAIVFAPCDPEEVGEYVMLDPYVANGLVTNWKILPWTVVV